MTLDRKKPGVAFRATVLLVAVLVVVVLVAYPLSFGPACWIAYRLENKNVSGAVERFYYPIFWLWAVSDGNSPARHAIGWYMNLGYPDESEGE